jgi:hypothetical protein
MFEKVIRRFEHPLAKLARIYGLRRLKIVKLLIYGPPATMQRN